MKADREEFEEKFCGLKLTKDGYVVIDSKKISSHAKAEELWQWIQQNYVSKAVIDKMIEKLRGSPDWHSCDEVEEILTELKDKAIKKGIFRWDCL